MDNNLLLFFGIMITVFLLVLVLLYMKKMNRYHAFFNVIAVGIYFITLTTYIAFFIYSFFY